MTSLQDLAQIAFIGIGATAVMDVWLLLLKRMGAQTLDFALIGRWVGHLFRGRIAHASIRQSPRIRHELVWGWLTHYAIGIAFAGLLVLVQGLAWTQSPSLLPALAVGMITVVAPLLVMQPAMGSGVAGSKTPTPLKNCLKSLANHTVFGLGLYVSAVLLALVAR
jgi:polyferredoxin